VHYPRLSAYIMRNVAMMDESWGEGTLNSKAGAIINNSGSVEDSIRHIKASCAVLSFYPEAENLRKPEGAERGDGHHTRHILGATSLAVDELLLISSRLITADLTNVPAVVSYKMVGGAAVVRVRAPALTSSEVRHRTHPPASRRVLR
jgi:hypothetical protein